MKNRTLQGGDFYPSRLAGVKGSQLRSRIRHDYITKLCRRQAEVILNHENPNVHAIGQGEPRHRKYKRLNLGSGQAYDCSSV
jgi:hypothetical protein